MFRAMNTTDENMLSVMPFLNFFNQNSQIALSTIMVQLFMNGLDGSPFLFTFLTPYGSFNLSQTLSNSHRFPNYDFNSNMNSFMNIFRLFNQQQSESVATTLPILYFSSCSFQKPLIMYVKGLNILSKKGFRLNKKIILLLLL